MMLAAIDVLRETGQYAEAYRPLRGVLDDPAAGEAGGPVAAGGTAGGEARPACAGDGVPGAMLDAEYRNQPEVIDLCRWGEEYGRLLGHYQDLANVLERLKMRPPDNFVSTVVRTADRWARHRPGSGRRL